MKKLSIVKKATFYNDDQLAEIGFKYLKMQFEGTPVKLTFDPSKKLVKLSSSVTDLSDFGLKFEPSHGASEYVQVKGNHKVLILETTMGVDPFKSKPFLRAYVAEVMDEVKKHVKDHVAISSDEMFKKVQTYAKAIESRIRQFELDNVYRDGSIGFNVLVTPSSFEKNKFEKAMIPPVKSALSQYRNDGFTFDIEVVATDKEGEDLLVSFMIHFKFKN